jgi:hypothetical protein
MNRDLSASSGTLCSVKNVNPFIFLSNAFALWFKLNNAEHCEVDS